MQNFVPKFVSNCQKLEIRYFHYIICNELYKQDRQFFDGSSFEHDFVCLGLCMPCFFFKNARKAIFYDSPEFFSQYKINQKLEFTKLASSKSRPRKIIAKIFATFNI